MINYQISISCNDVFNGLWHDHISVTPSYPKHCETKEIVLLKSWVSGKIFQKNIQIFKIYKKKFQIYTRWFNRQNFHLSKLLWKVEVSEYCLKDLKDTLKSSSLMINSDMSSYDVINELTMRNSCTHLGINSIFLLRLLRWVDINLRFHSRFCRNTFPNRTPLPTM